MCLWGGEGEDLCEGSLYLCVCVRVCEGGNYQIYSGLNHQRETKRHIWSPSLETRLICIYCMCTRDPRCTHARSRYRALGRGVRIPVVYSPPVLAAFTPSCRTLLSWYISPVSSPGLHLSHQSPAQHCPTRWRCGCLCSKWCYHNHKWKLGGSTSLCFPFFLFFFCLFVCLLLSGKGGCLSHEYTEDNVRNQFIIKDVLHNTMPFTQRSSGLCQVCSHSFKQPGFSNLLILFVDTVVWHPFSKATVPVWRSERIVKWNEWSFSSYSRKRSVSYTYFESQVTTAVCVFLNLHHLWRTGKKSFSNMGVEGGCAKHHSRGNLWLSDLSPAEASQCKKYKSQIGVGVISVLPQMFFRLSFYKKKVARWQSLIICVVHHLLIKDSQKRKSVCCQC